MTERRAFVPLVEAGDASTYGGKAANLAGAIACGLPVPPGWALGWADVEALCAGDVDLPEGLASAGPVAVRSSAVGEDSEDASFAGMHLTVLGVVGSRGVVAAVNAVYDSGTNAGAMAYREIRGIDGEPRMGVVIQCMVAAEVAGVLFTRNPVSGAHELVIEASWGLGESVVSGAVTPDHLRVDHGGTVLERLIGDKDVELRLEADGSTAEYDVPAERAEQPCLTDAMVAELVGLVRTCDSAYAAADHDIEFAFADGALHLLQRRPLTHG